MVLLGAFVNDFFFFVRGPPFLTELYWPIISASFSSLKLKR